MRNFLAPSPDATTKVPQEKVSGTYIRRQWGVLIAASGSYIGYYILRLIFTTEQKPIMAAYGFTLGQVGFVLSMFGIGYGCAKLVMGTLSDRTNAKVFLALGLYVSAVLNFFLGATQNFYLVCALMFLSSLSQGIGAATCHKLINFWFSKKHRGVVYSTWEMSQNLGTFLCVVVIQAAAYVFSGSLTAVFWSASVVTIILATIMLLINSERPTAVGLPPIAAHAGDVELDAKGQDASQEIASVSVFQVFRNDILKNPVVWVIALTAMANYIVRYGVVSWIPSYLPTRGFSDEWAKWMLGIFELVAIPGVIILGLVSDYLKGRRALVCFFCTVALLVCVVFYFASPNKVVITVALFAMGNFIYAPLALVALMVNEAVPKYAVGASTGFMGFFQYIFGETLGTALISNLVDKFGWGANAIAVFAGGVLILLLLVYLMIREHRTIVAEQAAALARAD